MIFDSQYCFSNISAAKAPIFIKFETSIHKIVKNYQKIFREDLCTHARKQGVHVRARVSSWQNASAHVYASLRAGVYTVLYEKSFDNYLLSFE